MPKLSKEDIKLIKQRATLTEMVSIDVIELFIDTVEIQQQETDTLKHLLKEMILYMPGVILTSDMGKCRICENPTSSGMLKICSKCLYEVAKDILRR